MKAKLFNFLQNLLFILSIIICAFILAQKFIFKENGVFGYRTFVIITSSMSPRLEIGDVIVVKDVPTKEIEVDDIITYQGKESDFKGKIVTHLVKTIDKDDEGNYLFYTKGTVSNMVDPVVKEDQIYGKVVFRLFIISLVSKIIRSKLGFFLLIFIPLILILIKQLYNIKHEIKGDKKEDEMSAMIREYKKKNKKKFGLFKRYDGSNEVLAIKDTNEELEKTIYSSEFREELEKELEKTIMDSELKNKIEEKLMEEETAKVQTPSRGLENTLINSNLVEEIMVIQDKVPDIIIIED